MNILRRQMLHPIMSRHNPITRLARFMSLFAIALGAVIAASEILALYQRSAIQSARIAADTVMIAEIAQVLEGKAKLVDGEYEIRAVKRKRPVYVFAENE